MRRLDPDRRRRETVRGGARGDEPAVRPIQGPNVNLDWPGRRPTCHRRASRSPSLPGPGGTSIRPEPFLRWPCLKTLEEITYDAGRHALADQESLVGGIRQRAGTLVAAHAVVASFLGGTVLRTDGLKGWGWLAIAALVLALGVAALLLAPGD